MKLVIGGKPGKITDTWKSDYFSEQPVGQRIIRESKHVSKHVKTEMQRGRNSGETERWRRPAEEGRDWNTH